MSCWNLFDVHRNLLDAQRGFLNFFHLQHLNEGIYRSALIIDAWNCRQFQNEHKNCISTLQQNFNMQEMLEEKHQINNEFNVKILRLDKCFVVWGWKWIMWQRSGDGFHLKCYTIFPFTDLLFLTAIFIVFPPFQAFKPFSISLVSLSSHFTAPWKCH